MSHHFNSLWYHLELGTFLISEDPRDQKIHQDSNDFLQETSEYEGKCGGEEDRVHRGLPGQWNRQQDQSQDGGTSLAHHTTVEDYLQGR